MTRLRRVLRDERGGAAVEFALLLPMLATIMLLGVDGWFRINQASQMRSALQTAARYYQMGGADDTAASALAAKAWAHKPGDGAVNIARSCTCAGAGAACTSLCSDTSLPLVFVNMTATGTYAGLTHSETLTTTAIVRVR
jgi:Flp pilus assembly protein TadG